MAVLFASPPLLLPHADLSHTRNQTLMIRHSMLVPSELLDGLAAVPFGALQGSDSTCGLPLWG